MPDLTINIIANNIEQLELEEYSTEKVEDKDGQITKTLKTVKGFFYDERRSIGVIDSSANLNLVSKGFGRLLLEEIEIMNIYEGDNYLLVKSKNDLFTFNIQLYKKLRKIIEFVSNAGRLKIEKQVLTNKGKMLVLIANDKTKFILMGLLGNNYDEEERIILSKKIEHSKPFFEIEPFTKVNWKLLKDKKGATFENLCEVLLQNNSNIIDVQPIGKTNAADRGRDFIVTENVIDIKGSKEIKWLVQCKYATKSVSTSTINGWTDRVIEHHVDGYWLMTNNDITPSLFDQLNDSSKNDKFDLSTRIWARNKFDIQFNLQAALFSSEFFKSND